MKVRNAVAALALFAVLVSFAVMVYAESNGPLGAETVTVIKTETTNLSLYDPATVNAEAGNVTELSITGVSQTKTWQGYYGNVSGTIILEDAQGNRFYDWTAAEPQGEVFASMNQTVTWTDVNCAPIDDSGYLTTWNDNYNITYEDYDNINVTYNLTDHPQFYVGTLTQLGCRTTYTFVNDARQFNDFPGVLLASDSNGTLIFTAIIENRTIGAREGKPGFDGADHDFQILVAEDGQGGNDAVTPYYFWIELE